MDEEDSGIFKIVEQEMNNLQVQENCLSNYLIQNTNGNPFETLNNYLSHSNADNMKRKTDSVNLNWPKKQKTAARNCSEFDCSTNIPEEELNSIIPKEEQLIQAREQQRLAHPVEEIDSQDEPQAAVPLTTKDKCEWVQRVIVNIIAEGIDYMQVPPQTNFVEAVEQKRPSIVNSIVDDGKTIIERVDFMKEENDNATNKIANFNFLAATSIPIHEVNQSRNNEDDFDMMEQDDNENSQFTCESCCSLCYRSLASNAVSSTECGHIFCTSCAKRANKFYFKCPICYKKLSSKKRHPFFM